MKKEIQFLLEHGFKKKYLSDKSGYWWQKNIKHRYFNKLHITIELDWNTICVWCEEPRNLTGRNTGSICIFYSKYSRKKVYELLIMFNKNSL